MRKRSWNWILFPLLVFLLRSVECILNKEVSQDEVHHESNRNQMSEIFKIERKPLSQVHSEIIHFVITNEGSEDDYLHVNISDDKGYVKQNRTAEFSLPAGSKRDIPVELDFPIVNGTKVEHDMDVITVKASGKRNTVTKRSLFFTGNDLEFDGLPVCYHRYVTGNCRYRTDPAYCYNYEWTAYAIVQNLGGYGSSLHSIPKGLYVPPFIPGSRERVRVWVKTSCCTPFVEILSSDHTICIIDVRELQWLHPGEIAAIVIGIVLLVIIIIIATLLLLRRRRTQTIVVGHHTTSRERISPKQ